jgi:hypothetical protein
MCGRYALKNPEALKDAFNLEAMPYLEPEDSLTEWPVSRKIDNPRHEGPDCAGRAT